MRARSTRPEPATPRPVLVALAVAMLALALLIAGLVLRPQRSSADPRATDVHARDRRARRRSTSAPVWQMTIAPDGGAPSARPLGDGGVAEIIGAAPETLEVLTPLALEIYDRVCVPVVAAICAARARCCGEPSSEGQSCSSLQAEHCAEWANRFAGSALLDAQIADRCIAHIARTSAQCMDPWIATECRFLARIDVEPGEDCRIAEREDRTSMGVQCNEGRCVDGVCLEHPGIGERCDDLECDEGLCNENSICVLFSGAGGACDTAFDCERPLACREGRCVTGSPSGAACRGAADCAMGLACIEGVCASSELCASDEDCGNEWSCSGLTRVLHCSDSGCEEEIELGRCSPAICKDHLWDDF